RGRDQCTIDDAVKWSWQATSALLQRHAGARMRARLPVGEAAPKVGAQLDGADVLHALVAVQMRHDEPQRSAVVERDGIALQSIGEQHVFAEEILEQNTGAVTV